MKHRYNQSGVLDKSEKIENPLIHMEQLVQNFLPLKQFDFKESARFITATTNPTIIYDSQWCRLAFSWERWEMYSGNSIDIEYGRLHALDGSVTMDWNREQCYCWHTKMGTSNVLDFLDGLTPQESVNKKEFPKLIEEIRQTDWFQNMSDKRRGPELALKIESKIWDHYDIRLFELFDLRRQDLWEKYRQWLRTCYSLEGKTEEGQKKFGILIPSYRVC